MNVHQFKVNNKASMERFRSMLFCLKGLFHKKNIFSSKYSFYKLFMSFFTWAKMTFCFWETHILIFLIRLSTSKCLPLWLLPNIERHIIHNISQSRNRKCRIFCLLIREVNGNIPKVYSVYSRSLPENENQLLEE